MQPPQYPPPGGPPIGAPIPPRRGLSTGAIVAVVVGAVVALCIIGFIVMALVGKSEPSSRSLDERPTATAVAPTRTLATLKPTTTPSPTTPSPTPTTPTPAPTTTPPAPAPTPTIDDGTWSVGVDFPAGTYRTVGAGDSCYWGIYKSGTNEEEIIQNHIGGGNLTVTLKAGQDFASKRCGIWKKVR